MKQTYRLAVLSLLCAAALIIFIAEAQIPPIIPLPGIKLGLANIITLITAARFRKRDVFAVLFVRIILGSVFCGTFTGFLYSISGGMCCAAVTVLIYPLFKDRLIWVTSVISALAHNAGQIAAAAVIMNSVTVLYYIPPLIISAVITGMFVGAASYFILKNSYFNHITENANEKR